MSLLPDNHLTAGESLFLREVESSTCLLLPTTPSPTPIDFNHPLALADNSTDVAFLGISDGNSVQEKMENEGGDSSSSSESMVQDPVSAQLINNISMLDYQTLSKTGDLIIGQDDDRKVNGNLVPSGRKLPEFVKWKWGVIRWVLLWVVVSGLCACCAAVLGIMLTLPRQCDPDLPWYQGKVFYEVFTASFMDSNGDGFGDLQGITLKADYIQNLGIGAVRLNSIFQADQYPEQYLTATSLLSIDKRLGTIQDFLNLTKTFHAKNISVVLDFPVYPYVTKLPSLTPSDAMKNNYIDYGNSLKNNSVHKNVEIENSIVTAIKYWTSRGVDGFYLKGVENLVEDEYFEENLRLWKRNVGFNKILMLSKEALFKAPKRTQDVILSKVDLIDAYIEVNNGSTFMKQQVEDLINDERFSRISAPWIHWNVGNINTERLASKLSANNTLAILMTQVMLPGTPSLFYGDEVALQGLDEIKKDIHEDINKLNLVPMRWPSQDEASFTITWIRSPDGNGTLYRNVDIISKSIKVRRQFPSIYQNSIYKDASVYKNAAMSVPAVDVLVVERWYPRRNSFVLLANLGTQGLHTDLSAMFYGGRVLVSADKTLEDNDIYFKDITLSAGSVLLMKLEK